MPRAAERGILLRPLTPGRKEMTLMTAGVTPAGTGIDGIAWNILGQTYVPMQRSESSMAWHATFPPAPSSPRTSTRRRRSSSTSSRAASR